MILLVGTVYSELTTPTGLGPHSCSWTPGHKTQTPMKQVPQVSSLSCAQVEETRVDNASYKSFKEEDVREDIDRTQAAVSDCNIRDHLRLLLTKTGCSLKTKQWRG